MTHMVWVVWYEGWKWNLDSTYGGVYIGEQKPKMFALGTMMAQMNGSKLNSFAILAEIKSTFFWLKVLGSRLNRQVEGRNWPIISKGQLVNSIHLFFYCVNRFNLQTIYSDKNWIMINLVSMSCRIMVLKFSFQVTEFTLKKENGLGEIRVM